MLSLDPTVGRQADIDMVVGWSKVIKNKGLCRYDRPALEFIEYVVEKYTTIGGLDDPVFEAFMKDAMTARLALET